MNLFISYASSDQPLAMEVCALLEARGVSCWIAPRNVAPGAKWDEAILDAIESASAFLLILTDAANASPYVSNEVNEAFEKKKTIVTFRAEEVLPAKSLKFSLGRSHWIDGFSGRLDEKVGQLAQALSGAVSPAAMQPARARRGLLHLMRGRRRWTTVVSWTVGALGVAFGAWTLATRTSSSQPIDRPTLRVEVSLPPGLERHAISLRSVAVSPDSSQVAFIGIDSGIKRIYLRPLGRFETTAIRGTENANLLFFSPDGRSIGFVDESGNVRTVSLVNGATSTLADNANLVYGAAWVGRDVVFHRANTLWRVAVAGDAAVELTKLDTARGETLHGWPFALPDGRTLLFGVVSKAGSSIETVDLDTGQRRGLVERGELPLYAPGRLLYFRDGELFGAPFDVTRMAVVGPHVKESDLLPVQDGILSVDASISGALVSASTIALGRLVWVARDGTEELLDGELRSYSAPRLAPGGSRLLVQTAGLWIRDLTRGTFSRAVARSDTGSQNAFPQWFPDGSRFIFRGSATLETQSPDGGTSLSIPGTRTYDVPYDFTPDGRHLVLGRTSSTDGFDLVGLPFPAGGEPTPILKTRFYEGGAQLSPDGRWLAYVANDSGQLEVYIRPFAGGDRRWPVSTGGGRQPVWNPRGGELFYRSGNRMMAVSVVTAGAELRLSTPKVLFERRYMYGPGISVANYDVSADGQRFVMVKAEDSAARVNVVLNAFQ